MLYRLAIETGLRASELRSLTVSSFDFNNCTVTIEAENAKNKKTQSLPLRTETASELKDFTAGKLPNVTVFNIPNRTADMLKADLEASKIDYQDEDGRYVDFHSLRHTTGTLLAASGVHPKVAQSLMRHSDINLTMSLYTHTLRGQESEAIENLLDLSLPSKEKQRATGTDDMPVDSAYKCAYKKLAKKSDFDSNPMSSLGFDDRQKINQHTQTDETTKPLQTVELDTKKKPMSSTDTGKKTNERYRTRTYDPLIKSQLLYQLS